MATVESQEKERDIRRLRKILAQVSPPARSDNEWERISQSLFASLDKQEKGPSPRNVYAFVRPRPLAWAAAAVLVCAASVFVTLHFFRTHALPANTAIQLIEGPVTIVSHIEQKHSPRQTRATLATGLTSGSSIKLDDNATVAIMVDSGTGFSLTQQARLFIAELTLGRFEGFLEQGTITAMVAPRAKPMHFVITTPDAECHVKGTYFTVSVEKHPGTNLPQTTCTVYRGTVHMETAEKSAVSALVTAGTQARSGHHKIHLDSIPSGHAPPRSGAGLTRMLSHGPNANFATCRIETQPPGADFFIRDDFIGKTPLTLRLPAKPVPCVFSYLDVAHRDTILKPRTDEECTYSVALLPAGIEEHTLEKPDRAASRPPKRTAQPKQPAVSPMHSGNDHFPNPQFEKARTLLLAGDHTGALKLLSPFDNEKEYPARAQADLFELRGECHMRAGHYDTALTWYEQAYPLREGSTHRDHVLWKIITLKTEYLQAYEQVEMDLVEYIIAHDKGIWISEAYVKLAEIQYLLKKYEAAVRTYSLFIRKFEQNTDIDRALYALAHILRQDLHSYTGAIRWYSELLDRFPRSRYAENALFWRAHCYQKNGRSDDARKNFRLYLARYPSGKWRTAAARATKQ